MFEDTVKKEDYQKQLQRTALRRATRQLKSPPNTVMSTPNPPQCVDTPLTHKIGDGTNLFELPQRDMAPTPLDQSMEDYTTAIQRNRIVSPSTLRQVPNLTHKIRTASPLTRRREPNLFETVKNLSKQNRQRILFNQLPQPRRILFMQTPSTIGDSLLLTPSPGSVRPVRTYSPTMLINDYSLLTPETIRRQTHYTRQPPTQTNTLPPNTQYNWNIMMWDDSTLTIGDSPQSQNGTVPR